MLGGDAYDRPTRWLIAQFEKSDPNALASAIHGGLDGLKADLKYASRAKMKQHVADLVAALEESSSPALQRAALDILQAVADEDRATLATMGGLRNLACLLVSSDEGRFGRQVHCKELRHRHCEPELKQHLQFLLQSMTP